MALEMPGRHELRHHRLSADFRVAHVHRAAPGKGLDQADRQHQVAQAQRRKGHLAESPDIQHPPRAIEGRQWRQGRAAVAVLTVVVILDDPAARTLGPGQQFQAPGQAHHHAGGVLMGRGDVGQAATAEAVQGSAVDALAVHRHAMQLATRHRERMACCPIPRILDGNLIAGLHQQLCTKADCLLRATSDHYLLSRALHAARTA
jgi:hypothetical protein